MGNQIKRPVNLLCLSDLHLDSWVGETVLQKLRQAVIKLKGNEIRWKPDFIVLAGDLVDARNKGYYPRVRTYLDAFTEDDVFQLDPFRIIAVPGNHDKDLPCWTDSCYKRASRCAVCKELDKSRYLREASEDEDVSFNYDLKENFDSNFKRFGAFYSHFVANPKEGEAYIYPEKYLGKNLSDVALTSGMKVFEDAKICFLCINTEWLYFPDEERRYDEGFLCPQVIQYCLNAYYNDYKGYTLVTVMHHNPSEMSWKTRFRSKPYKPDLLRSLYQYSDIILTGHNHTEILLPPDRMENHAQLFQLGPAAMTFRDDTLPQYHASLLHVDSLSGFVKICNFRFDHVRQDWKWEIDRNDYPIAPYAAMLHPGTPPSLAESIVIPLQSHRNEEIGKALNSYFPSLKESYAVHWKGLNDEGLLPWIQSTFEQDRNPALGGRKKSAFFIYSLADLDRKTFQQLKASVFSVEALREAVYRKELILIQVWFKYRDPHATIGMPPPPR